MIGGGLIKETFWFKKSLYDAPIEKSTEVTARKSSLIHQADKRILLGEGQPVLQKVYRACLEQIKCLVDSANIGKQMLELYYSRHYSLIILGGDLSDMTCLAIAQSIRVHEQANGRTSIPILLLTETSFEQIKTDYERLNINDFLIKPVRLPELQIIVQRWLA